MYTSFNTRVSPTLKIHKLYTMNVSNVKVIQMSQKAAILAISPVSMSQEEFESSKDVIIIRKSMKDRQHNCQKKKDKRTNNDL